MALRLDFATPRTFRAISRAFVSSLGAVVLASASLSDESTAAATPSFPPSDPGPARTSWSTPGDGVWSPIADSSHPNSPPRLYKTVLRPDRSRSWAEVFIVAVDLTRVDAHLMAGTQEPRADDPHVEYERAARIPPEHQGELIAAFNGGFRTEHGAYGMKVDGIVLVRPKPTACTFARFEDGSMRIASWRKIADDAPTMAWYRQTPECLFEDGTMNAALAAGRDIQWGATREGETVIRRSAVGLGATRRVLYVAISNDTTARALADAMHHAGAVDVAEMDVNWSYPKFVLFEAGPGSADGHSGKVAVSLVKGFEGSRDDYVRRKSPRDFFYLTGKEASILPLPPRHP